MEQQDEDKKSKKLNDDTVIFLRKRSETETPRYAARLRAYVDLHRKRSRAAAARRRSDHGHEGKTSASRKKGEPDSKDNKENSINTPYAARKSTCGLSGEHPGAEDDRMSRRRGGGGEKTCMGRTRSRSPEPSDRCGRRRRRRRRSCSRRRRRRRRRSCRRRRRRRRSCRRRRRRRSRSRRRRRRSCRRRRKRRRRC